MKPKFWISGCLVSVAVFLGALVVVSVISRVIMGPMGFVNEYEGVAIGDPAQNARRLVGSDQFILIGSLKRVNGKIVWTKYNVLDGPYAESLQRDDLKQNRFLSNLGWTYPESPTAYEMIILNDTERDAVYVFYLIDEDQKVEAIFLGGT